MGSSYVIDIGSLLHAGRPIALDEPVTVPPFGEIGFPAPARARLDLQRVGRGVQVGGSIDVEASGACDRCLDDVRVPLHIEVDERFDPADGTSDPFGENNVLNGTELDVGDLVRQLVTAALPFGLVCSEDCPGLCAVCGQRKTGESRCDCSSGEGEHGES